MCLQIQFNDPLLENGPCRSFSHDQNVGVGDRAQDLGKGLEQGEVTFLRRNMATMPITNVEGLSFQFSRIRRRTALRLSSGNEIGLDQSLPAESRHGRMTRQPCQQRLPDLLTAAQHPVDHPVIHQS